MPTIRRRGTLQDLAERLDPIGITMLVDEGSQDFSRRSSSDWAKNALASLWASPGFPDTSNDMMCLGGKHAKDEKSVYGRVQTGSGDATARRSGAQVAVCYMDLDGFKAINDTHGHHAGDELLKAVSHRLLGNLRPSDTAARMGGDEFVLILAEVPSDEWRVVLERVAAAVEQPIFLASGETVRVGATIGVALSTGEDSDNHLLHRADQVMLHGKKAAKGRIFVT